MKEAVVDKGPSVRIIDSPIPEPKENQVLIKVVACGSNPKDWKMPEWLGTVANQGEDMAGVVDKVGANVTEFKPGDRVGAYHEIGAPHGAYAEYAIAEAHCTFHLPKGLSYEDAATLPLAAMTAAIGLYDPARLGLPQPWTPAREREPTPLVIYGASSAVGAYAVQLARLSDIHPLICVAGAARGYVETLIDRSRGDAVVDYREGDEAVVEGIRKALGGRELMYAYDAVSEKGSYQNICKVLAPGSCITFVLPKREYEVPEYVTKTVTVVADAHKQLGDLAFVYFRYIARAVETGRFKCQRVEVIPGGLGGIQAGLENLKAGRASAVKYVYRVAETEGVGK